MADVLNLHVFLLSLCQSQQLSHTIPYTNDFISNKMFQCYNLLNGISFLSILLFIKIQLKN
jgi:hypothetical protein